MTTAERIYWLRHMATVPLGYWVTHGASVEYQQRRARWDWRWR